MNISKHSKPRGAYFKFPELEYLKYKLEAKKATIRLKVNTLRAKWLQELK